MAWIYQLWVESDQNGNAIRDHFLSYKAIELENKTYKINASQSGVNGSMISVDGISRSGINSVEDAKEMTKIGFNLYTMLKTAPLFRYAVAGVEVDGWIEMEDEHLWQKLIQLAQTCL